jgi:hypothetical protein
MSTEKGFKTKCVSLKGELAHLGKHILMPGGVTLCGCPIVDYDKKLFPILKEKEFENFPSEYEEHEWEITCPRCLEMIDILESAKRSKEQMN